MELRTTYVANVDHKVSVAQYCPGEHHKQHCDPYSRVSILLAGSLCEEGHNGPISMQPGDILLKSNRAVHEDRFGEAGAVLASIEFKDAGAFECTAGSGLAHGRAGRFAFPQAVTLLEAAYAGDATGAGIAGTDLLAACTSDDGCRRRPPPWLSILKEEIADLGLAGIDVAARARSCGVHPVHASRLFRQCFGLSITEHARDHNIRRALPIIARTNLSLSQAALDAGFYDQSHMNRTFQRVLGRTPQNVRRLLKPVSR